MSWEYSLKITQVAFKCQWQTVSCLSTFFDFHIFGVKVFYSFFALRLWFQAIIIHTEYNEYIKGEGSLWRACVFLIIYQAPVSCDLGLIMSCERQLVMLEYWCPAEKLSLSLPFSRCFFAFISRLFAFSAFSLHFPNSLTVQRYSMCL